jgi:hypothetical protein
MPACAQAGIFVREKATAFSRLGFPGGPAGFWGCVEKKYALCAPGAHVIDCGGRTAGFRNADFGFRSAKASAFAKASAGQVGGTSRRDKPAGQVGGTSRRDKSQDTGLAAKGHTGFSPGKRTAHGPLAGWQRDGRGLEMFGLLAF